MSQLARIRVGSIFIAYESRPDPVPRGPRSARPRSALDEIMCLNIF